MCTLYRLENPAAAARLFGAEWPDGLPTTKSFYPDRPAPIIRAGDGGGRFVELARWGVPPPPDGDRPVVNIRNLHSPFWRGLNKAANRCLVPATAFAEWTAERDPATGKKTQHWFALKDGAPFALAGMTRRDRDANDDVPPELRPLRFAFLTTAPNPLVAAIHPRAMPVVLTGDAADAWLGGVPAEALAEAFPAEDMQMLQA